MDLQAPPPPYESVQVVQQRWEQDNEIRNLLREILYVQKEILRQLKLCECQIR